MWASIQKSVSRQAAYIFINHKRTNCFKQQVKLQILPETDVWRAVAQWGPRHWTQQTPHRYATVGEFTYLFYSLLREVRSGVLS